MRDRENVALIGSGQTFGNYHGRDLKAQDEARRDEPNSPKQEFIVWEKGRTPSQVI
jgi:catalase (peroxidase I)